MTIAAVCQNPPTIADVSQHSLVLTDDYCRSPLPTDDFHRSPTPGNDRRRSPSVTIIYESSPDRGFEPNGAEGSKTVKSITAITTVRYLITQVDTQRGTQVVTQDTEVITKDTRMATQVITQGPQGPQMVTQVQQEPQVVTQVQRRPHTPPADTSGDESDVTLDYSDYSDVEILNNLELASDSESSGAESNLPSLATTEDSEANGGQGLDLPSHMNEQTQSPTREEESAEVLDTGQPKGTMRRLSPTKRQPAAAISPEEQTPFRPIIDCSIIRQMPSRTREVEVSPTEPKPHSGKGSTRIATDKIKDGTTIPTKQPRGQRNALDTPDGYAIEPISSPLPFARALLYNTKDAALTIAMAVSALLDLGSSIGLIKTALLVTCGLKFREEPAKILAKDFGGETIKIVSKVTVYLAFSAKSERKRLELYAYEGPSSYDVLLGWRQMKKLGMDLKASSRSFTVHGQPYKIYSNHKAKTSIVNNIKMDEKSDSMTLPVIAHDARSRKGHRLQNVPPEEE